MSKSNITYPQLIALYEISRKINSQLNFKELLKEIMDLAIELLHAEKGLLLLRNDATDELHVEVARLMDRRTIADVVELSRTIIKKVETEGKPILLKKVPHTGRQSASSSLAKYKIKSVVCVPLTAKEKIIGTIYLDTTKRDCFFKDEDLVFLEGFANLAAVAITNARAYQEIKNLNENLEQLVDQRTQQLQDKHSQLENAYHELKDTQMQLIRSEKMASLGHLVAGIAHEINTPLGSILSNTDMFLRSFEKLRRQLGGMQLSHDIDKTIDVLDNLSQVNKMACDRISGIVKALKNFARLDEEDLKTVDLHQGLDNTLCLTAHLNRERIKVVKDYGAIPELRCYANQLNQVFMNLLVNSMQAIQGKGVITIQTRREGPDIVIKIKDSGCGIQQEHLEKIFDPGFTTKGVGVGTGLGLSISYKIIEEHKGRIEVKSKTGKGTEFILRLPIENGL